LGDAPVPINLNAFTAPGSEAHTPEKPVACKGPSRTSAMSPGAPPGAAYIIGGVVLIGVGFFKGGSVFMGSADFMGWFFDILGIFSICLGGCLELIRG
ncbi:MAG: hypothetical protein GY859_19615, partial [Desulfobacterales bacterium]|nr:hypothetical protein [Desulfobacterales bacterium]